MALCYYHVLWQAQRALRKGVREEDQGGKGKKKPKAKAKAKQAPPHQKKGNEEANEAMDEQGDELSEALELEEEERAEREALRNEPGPRTSGATSSPLKKKDLPTKRRLDFDQLSDDEMTKALDGLVGDDPGAFESELD